MLRTFISYFFLLGSLDGISQNIQQEINNQVWRVQLAAMNSNQADRFMSTMSEDVIQISYDRQTLRNKEEFRNQAVATYKRLAERKVTRTMEFRFLNRIANAESAFEDGFYKYELTNEKLEKQTFYGYFQVVLRKEKDLWKVVVDYDSEKYNGVAVTQEVFERARTLDSFNN
jgi:ketosteroid isomerase-like protein